MESRRRRPLRLAYRVSLLPVLFLCRPAHADMDVVIDYDSDDALESVRRVRSELSSEGYTVQVRAVPEHSPCDPGAPRVTDAPGTKIWIHVAAGPPGGNTITASICYLATAPSLQQFSATAPSGEPHQLALATAEALNGLRSQLPLTSGDGDRGAGRDRDVHVDGEPATRDHSRSERFAAPERPLNSIVLGSGLVVPLPDVPAAPGIVARATLGFAPLVGITMDAFLPIAGSELSSPQVTATVRTAWLRIGPRFGGAFGAFDISGAALAGPALTWATAVARAPRVGTADMSAGAVISLAAFVEYPRRANIFACGSASASALLPGVRVKLGDDASAPRESWLVEATIGLGVRWGEGQ